VQLTHLLVLIVLPRYPPNLNAPPDFLDDQIIYKAFPEADGLWYWGCGDTGDVVANATIAMANASREVKR